jgi:hypothetical protein
MMLPSNAFSFVLLFAAACKTVTSATLAINLGDAGDYVILTKSGISTVPDSVITGNIGLLPIAAAAMTGFSLTLDSGGEFSTSTQRGSPPGKAYAANYFLPTPAALSTAVSNMETAYTDATGRTNPDAARINLRKGVLGGVYGGMDNDGATHPLMRGIYSTFGSSVSIAQDITFEGTKENQDQDPEVFIIQIRGNLTQATNTKVFLTGGGHLRRTSSGRLWTLKGWDMVRRCRVSFWASPRLYSRLGPPS